MNRRQAIKAGSAAALVLSTPPLLASKSELVELRTIPSTGAQLPCVGLGTWLTFDINSRDASSLSQRTAVIKALLQAGAAVIDSSPMYGQSEQVVGAASASVAGAEKLFLASKVWTHGERQGRRQMATSAEKMGKPTMDLLQIHNLMDWKTHMKTLQDMKERGEVRYIGITHYLAHAYGQMAAILKDYPIDFIQVNYNITASESGQHLLPLAADHGKAVIINRPFAGGSVFRSTRTKKLPAIARELQCDTWAQLLLKFVLAHPAVTCAIPGTSQAAHMTENAKAGLGPFPNSRQQQRILEAFRS